MGASGPIALLVAAGSGSRLGASIPKAFVELAGRPMLEWSIDALRAAGIAEIVVALPDGVGAPDGCVGVRGGATRSESVRAALAAGGPGDVVVHDAARPLVSDEVVERVLAPLSEGWDGVVPGLPVGDTLKRVGSDGGVQETVSRDGLWAVQTPQAFAADVLRRAQRRGGEATDCAGLVEAAGGRIKVVDGDPHLLKVTSEADLETVAGWR